MERPIFVNLVVVRISFRNIADGQSNLLVVFLFLTSQLFSRSSFLTILDVTA